MNEAPNQALQRTPGFGVQLPSAALVRPAQSRAVLPAMNPGTARAFALRRRAHSRAPGPESLSLGSLGVATHAIFIKQPSNPPQKNQIMKIHKLLLLFLAFCLSAD